MDGNFFAYLERLELLAFFSAYPLLYAIINVIAGNSTRKALKKIPSLLPYSYALTGTLYLGLQLRNLYPDYSFENILTSAQQPFLKIWALISILFWIPSMGKKPVISLLHSFVFFFFLLKDILSELFTSSADKNLIRNDMKLYTDSFVLNLGTFILLLIIYFLVRFKKGKTGSES